MENCSITKREHLCSIDIFYFETNGSLVSWLFSPRRWVYIYKKEILYETFSSEPNSHLLLNKTFKYNNKKFTALQIESVWGDSPCFLAYIMAKSETGTIMRFVARCKANVYSKNKDDRWILSIFKD